MSTVQMRRYSMTTEGENCGLSSLLPMSCRGRAEAFARRLHSRLTSLGNNDVTDSATETSWLQLGNHESLVSQSQPKHSSDTEMYLDYGLMEPPSPEEDIEEAELHRLINRDNLKHSHSEDCHCSTTKDILSNSIEKLKLAPVENGDEKYFDTENRLTNGFSHSESSDVISNGTYDSDESFATTSENTVPICSSLSEDSSTLSIKEDLFETNGSLTELTNGVEEKLKNGIETITNNEEILKNNDSSVHLNSLICNDKNETDKTSLCNGIETFKSSLSIDKELTVECPKKSEISIEIDICKDEEEEKADSENDDEKIPRVRRCSSLKTGKTPPGTPGRKKIVRFADVLGLDLADVRTFLDEIPKIPHSAFVDLRDVELNDGPTTETVNGITQIKYHGVKIDKVLLPLFQQPGILPNFMDIVKDNLVCLESAMIDDPINFSIKGVVRVRNLDFHKSVHIRYSLDSWKTFTDVQATYVPNSCDGFSDKFSFLLYARTISVGQRFEFAARFQAKGCQYWDNNKGINYCFQCLPSTNSTSYTPITGADVDHWGASFY